MLIGRSLSKAKGVEQVQQPLNEFWITANPACFALLLGDRLQATHHERSKAIPLVCAGRGLFVQMQVQMSEDFRGFS